MATQAASGDYYVSTTSKVGISSNDGGSVVKAGNADTDNDKSSSPITKRMGLRDITHSKDVNRGGSKVVEKTATAGDFTNPDGVIKAKSGGAGGLAYFPDARAGDRNFILRAAGATGAGKINNDAMNNLAIPGSQYDGVGVDGIHESLKNYQLGSASDVAFDMLAVPSSGRVPGRTKGSNAGDAISFPAPSGDGINVASDDAATPTRAVPGELTYHFGALGKPTTDEYKAKDSNE